jgi:hypothetical protein
LPLLLAAAGIAAILAVTAGSLAALRGAHEGPSSQVTASPQPSRPTVPPGYTTPPGPRRYPTRTAGEVLAGMATDPSVTGSYSNWDPQSLGAPIFVRALRASDSDLWLVPHITAGEVHGVYVVTLDKDGLGSAGRWAGGGGPNDPALAIPAVSEARAWEIAAVAMPDRGTAELVWMRVDPRSGFLVEEIWPMWMLTSRSGAVVYVTSGELLVSATQVEALR